MSLEKKIALINYNQKKKKKKEGCTFAGVVPGWASWQLGRGP